MEEVRGIGKEIGRSTQLPRSQIQSHGRWKERKTFGLLIGRWQALSEGNSTNLTSVTALAFSGGEIPHLAVAESKVIEAWPVPRLKTLWIGNPSANSGTYLGSPSPGFIPLTSVFFSGADNSTVRVWKFRGRAIKSMSMGRRPTICPFPPWGPFAVSGTLPGGSLWDYAAGKKVADLKGNPENVLSSAQKDRELAFSKTEQTYYKAELKKREDERKKVADRQKAVEKSLKEAEAKPIAEKKKAMDKALAESDEAKKAVDKQEESLVVLEKKIPDEETQRRLGPRS